MRQTTILLGTAGLTLVVLIVAFLAFRALTGPDGAAATPTPIPSTSAQEATATATASPTPVPSASGATASTATATAVATPVRTAGPTPVPGETVTYTVKGSQYVSKQIPPGGAISNLAGGAIKMTTGTASSDELTVTYRFTIPAGRVVQSYQVKVCGSGTGNFWETYGPPGANPVEYEFEPPAADGCWHFTGGSLTDTTVLAIIGLGSQMRVDRIVYILTFR